MKVIFDISGFVETHMNGKFTPKPRKCHVQKSLHIADSSGTFMGKPLKFILQIG